MGNAREQRTAALIVLATLALSAFFLAQGTTGLAAAYLLPIRPAPAPTPSRTAARAARRERTSDEQILRRNIFDPGTGDVYELPVATTEGGEEPAPVLVPWEPGQPTEPCAAANLRLVGAVVSPNTPAWSFAALVTEGAPKAMLFRTGMRAGSNELLEIQRDRVVVRPTSGPACHVAMFAEEAAPAARAVAAATPAAGPAATEAAGEGVTSDEITQGITKVSETEYNVSRDLVTRLMGNQADLMRMARVIPHEENGQVQGVKLYGIRRSSALGRLGVRNGDMIRSINGLDMTSPDAALQAFSQLPTTDRITLSLQRRGQDITNTYNLQ